jgi:N-acetylneuraminic acid mutarotase
MYHARWRSLLVAHYAHPNQEAPKALLLMLGWDWRMQELQPGNLEVIGPYRLLGQLGAGGMGQVFLGLSAGGRLVAVKVIRAELAADPEFRARFRRELAAARKVSGLFTAGVVDADVDGPVPWLATAYVAGPSLAQAVTDYGPLPAASVLALAAGLAESLTAIHAAGVVHRDLKPSNVLLAEDGPRVIDFGISHAAEATSLTRADLVIGSPGFMSPEQAEGGDVGPPSDVFSLGAVLVFAATGKGPFGAGSTAALVYRVVHGPANLDGVPGEVRLLAERCLAKDPGERPTAGDLLAEVGGGQLAAGWLPASLAAALGRYASPRPPDDAAVAGPSSSGAAGDQPADAGDWPSTVTTAGAGRTPTREGSPAKMDGPVARPARRDRRRLAWMAAVAIVIAVSASAAVVIATGGGSRPPAAVAGVHPPRSAPARWQFTGRLAVGHSNARLAQLADGRVLAISGATASGTLTSTAEIYDPGTGQWTQAGTLNDARVAFGQPSVLPDGDVLVAGGTNVNVVDYATAELYNPATNRWTFTGSLNTSRRYDVQVELANGEVLVATGSHGPPTCTRYLSSAELYDPATGQWTYTGSTLVPRESATAIRLADGRVLLAGGYNGGGSACTDTDPVDTEIYDPATGQWSFAGNLPHGWLGGVMVLLPDHRVLMVDGWQHGSGNFAEAVIFNPATNRWSEAARPIFPRSGAAATLLPDRNVLVSQGGQSRSEIYDPVTNAWSLAAATLDENNGGQTFLLPNGKVLLVGGDTRAGPSITAELYTPALSQTPR